MPIVPHQPDRATDCVTSDGAHTFRVAGYGSRSKNTRTDCQQPLRAVCTLCAHTVWWRCDCSSPTKCPDCSERRRKALARLVDLGTSQRIGNGHTYFLTLNGPGEKDHAKWVQGWRQKDGPRPACNCHHTFLTMSKGDWNAQESACWNRLRTALSRVASGMTYIGAVEVQKRGVLHRHVVLHTETPLTPAQVGDLALRAGYGCVHDLEPIRDAAKAAWYVSKYVTKSAGDRGTLPWRADVADETTGELVRMDTVPTFRTWSAAQSWGYTLKGLRDIARMQARARAEHLKALADAPRIGGGGGCEATTPVGRGDPPPP